MTRSKTRSFSELSEKVRARPGAAKEIDGRKHAIIVAVSRFEGSEIARQVGVPSTDGQSDREAP